MTTQQQQAQKLKVEGNALFQAGKYEAALKKYQEACRIDPSVPAYWSNAATCHEKLEQFEQMKQAAERCLHVDSSYVKGYYRLAVAQRELHELTDALAAVKKGLELKEGDDGLVMLKMDVEDRLLVVKCRNCGKPETSSVCGRCNVAAYCSQACQKQHWSVHKPSCLENMEDAFTCQNCHGFFSKQRNASRRICPKCGEATYCSRKCLLQHRSEHKELCEHRQTEKAMASSVGAGGEYKLAAEWESRSMNHIGMIAMSAMSKRQFMQSPPNFCVSIELTFDHNFLTYVPTKAPQVLPLERGEDLVRPATDHASTTRNSLLHLVLVEYTSPQSNFRSTSRLKIGYAPSQYCSSSLEDSVSNVRERVTLKPERSYRWKPEIRNKNIQEQAYWLMSDISQDVFMSFLLNALRLYSNKPRHKTRVLRINCHLGTELGQIEALTGYELVPMNEVRHVVSEQLSLSEEGLPSSPLVLPIVVIFRVVSLGFDCSLVSTHIVPETRISAAKCDAKAREYFCRLQSVTFPPVSSPVI